MIEQGTFPQRVLLGKTAEFIPVKFENSNAPAIIGALWRDMSKEYFSLNLSRADYPIGVGAMWEKVPGIAHEMIYFAGYEVHEIPDALGNLELLEIDSGNYAYLTHKGPMSEFPSAVRKFYGELLPDAHLVQREGLHLEIYVEGENPETDNKVLIAAPII